MKMMFAIINRDDAEDVCDVLRENGFMFTVIASTGGFLRAGNRTLLMGVEDEKCEQVMEIIKKNCAQRKAQVPNLIYADRGPIPSFSAGIATREVTVGGATVFITDVEKFVKF